MDLPNRKRVRLKNYDYRQSGYYFITICTYQKQKTLSTIERNGVCGNVKTILSPIGVIAERELLKIEAHYDNVKIDKYVIMPNHIHLIVTITERINPFPTKKYDISNIIGKYKAAITRSVGNAFMHSENIWQRSFHDHIIRDENDYRKIWNYIDSNPIKWQDDCFYTE